MNTDKIIDKVRKLINLANNAGASEGERDNATRMAHALLAKHNLDMSVLEAETGTVASDRKHDISKFQSSPWRRTVAHAMANLFFCEYAYMKGTNQHIFVGRKDNIITAQEMTMFVMKAIAKAGSAYGRENGGNKHRNNFLRGAADKVSARAWDIKRASQKQESTPSGTGTALVLADVYDTEKQKNNDLLNELFGRPTKGRSQRRRNVDWDAYTKGSQYGDSIQLNKQLS